MPQISSRTACQFDQEPTKSSDTCSVESINPQDAIHNNCRLLCLMSVTLKGIVANSVDLDQTARSSLI